MASTDAQQPKILIVGGGPSGLILALTLRRNGIPVRIIEKSTENRKGQRGAGIMPRSLELFEALGVYDAIDSRALCHIRVVRMYKMPEGVEVLKEFEPPMETPTPATPHINIRMLGQDSLDKILRAELTKAGCELELGVELETFEQFDDHVKVTLLKHSLDGNVDGAPPVTEKTSYDYVVGSDGAKSVVRKQLGMTLLGETTTEKFVTGDVKIEGLAPEILHIWGGMGNIMTAVRSTENEGIFNFFIGGTLLENPEEICANEELIRTTIKKDIGNREDVKIGEFSWVSPFTVNIRMTEAFQKGRVFLTGDAAHVHSPTGGQGMNTSVQDAFNLGWKLALVVKGLASPSILETFNEERQPVVAQMLQISTALLRETLANSEGEEGWNRTGNIKQLGVNYRWSSIVVDGEKTNEGAQGSSYDVGGAVRAGDRAPDAPGLVQIGDLSDAPATRLFKLFNPARHTVLLFAAKADFQPVLDVLQAYSGDIVRSIVIAETGKGASVLAKDHTKTIVVEDRDGHARDAYKGEFGVFVIRPDGVVGARVANVQGMERYFKAIFSA